MAANPAEDGSSDPIRLYTGRTRSYLRFIRLFAYPQGIRAYFRRSPLLRANLHILDAGCGTGIVTLALREALLDRGFQVVSQQAFDLTPKMLDIFRETLRTRAIDGVHLAQADVLHLETLADGWNDFDLVVSAAMMEYLPRERLIDALSGLRSLLNESGEPPAVHQPAKLANKTDYWPLVECESLPGRRTGRSLPPCRLLVNHIRGLSVTVQVPFALGLHH